VANRSDVREFLTSRRARLTPERVGLPAFGARRRVPGLRREEVALLAGVSVDYYTRLERGNLRGVSDGVLDALARALQLDEAECMHLRDLAQAANASTPTRRRQSPQRVRPSVQRLLDAITGAPAWVRNARMDYLAANRLGYALYSELFADPVRPPNNARFIFLNPRSRDFYLDWERLANDVVAVLRIEAGRNPYDRSLSDFLSANYQRAARYSALDGRRTTSGSTAAK
jgi:transcriptional regulator with XRE-family HTH domain